MRGNSNRNQIREMSQELATTPQNPMALLGQMDLSNVDPDKLEKLLNIQAVWEDRQAEKAFNSALADFQAEMPQVFKGRKESKGKYTYASYDDIMFIARPILRKNGLAISCSQSETETVLTIEMTISHKGGHSRKTTYSTPKDGPIKTQDGRNVTSQAQAQSSSNTYARRICLCNALDIVVTDEDDDGQASIGNDVTEEDINTLHNLFDQLPEESRPAFLAYMGVERAADIHSSSVKRAISALNAKLKSLSK